MRVVQMAAAVPLILLSTLRQGGVEPHLPAIAFSLNQGAVRSSTPPAADEFVGPFASWANLRDQYGASGD